MKTSMMAAAAFAVGILSTGCGGGGGGGGGGSTRNSFKYELVTATGTLTLNSQAAGSCTATSRQSMALSAATYSSVTYSRKTAKLDGMFELAWTKDNPTASNSCGAFNCSNLAGSDKTLLSIALAEELPRNPPENMMVVPVISGFGTEQLGDCGGELSLPDTLEADAFTLGSLMSPEFTLTGSGEKSLSSNTVQYQTTGTLTYSFDIKFRLRAE